ncbi:Pecanex-like protein 4, partial [Cladochytrium tenue]
MLPFMEMDAGNDDSSESDEPGELFDTYGVPPLGTGSARSALLQINMLLGGTSSSSEKRCLLSFAGTAALLFVYAAAATQSGAAAVFVGASVVGALGSSRLWLDLLDAATGTTPPPAAPTAGLLLGLAARAAAALAVAAAVVVAASTGTHGGEEARLANMQLGFVVAAAAAYTLLAATRWACGVFVGPQRLGGASRAAAAAHRPTAALERLLAPACLHVAALAATGAGASGATRGGLGLLTSGLPALLGFRAFRASWQDPFASAWDIAVCYLATGKSGGLPWLIWLFVVELGRGFVVRLYANFIFVVAYSRSFVADKKQRPGNYMIILVITATTSPASITSSIVADGQHVSSQDGSLYAGIVSSLVSELSADRKVFAPCGLIPGGPGPILARVENRLVLLRPVETWFEGCTVTAIGLEVQGTSCHNVEGLAIEEILEQKASRLGCPSIIPKVLLKAIGSISVRGYSESFSVITGVLDHPDTLEAFPALYFKCLQEIITISSALFAALIGGGAYGANFGPVTSESLVRQFIGRGNGRCEPSPLASAELQDWLESAGMEPWSESALLAWRTAVRILWQEAAGVSVAEDMAELLAVLDDSTINWHMAASTDKTATSPTRRTRGPGLATLPASASRDEAVRAGIPNIFVLGPTEHPGPNNRGQSRAERSGTAATRARSARGSVHPAGLFPTDGGGGPSKAVGVRLLRLEDGNACQLGAMNPEALR